MALNTSAVKAITYYKNVPFYADVFFYLMIMALIIAGIYGFVTWIINRQKNRLVVRIHNPDTSISSFVYRKFEGKQFHIESGERTSEGKKIYYDYDFIPEAVETGMWGRYIDYDLGNPIPINPRKRVIKESLTHLAIKFLNAIADTKLLVELVLSTKWKEFVTIMLWIIVIEGVIIIAMGGINLGYNPPVNCNLIPSNQTMSVIKNALLQR